MSLQHRRPVVIAHRGASGYLPEHTLAAYSIAIEFGADYIEPDLVMTKDGVLVARHENALAVLDAHGNVEEATTDVADRSEFANRCTEKFIDGRRTSGWFTEDFTFDELRTLRARERLPELRAENCRFDGKFMVPSFAEILDLIRSANTRRQAFAARLGLPEPVPIGVYPETKHPSYFTGIGLPLEQALVDLLTEYGYRERTAPVFIQSFELENLRELRGITSLPLIQLVENEGAPYDTIQKGSGITYADMVTPKGLAMLARYVDGIGVHKDLIHGRDAGNRLLPATNLVQHAHSAGLMVHAWTFRAENHFLPAECRQTGSTTGGLDAEITTFLESGVDGVFTDQADIGVKARDRFIHTRTQF